MREVISATNRLNGYILGEILTGTVEQDATENSNRRQGNQNGVHGSHCHDVKQVLTVNDLANFTVHTKADVTADII